jgi:hypothetical protein
MRIKRSIKNSHIAGTKGDSMKPYRVTISRIMTAEREYTVWAGSAKTAENEAMKKDLEIPIEQREVSSFHRKPFTENL